MAVKPKIFAPGAPDPAAKDPLEQDASRRIEEARQQKNISEADMKECYYFAAPRRIRSMSSQSSSDRPAGDAFQLQTSLAFECAEDFMTMVIDSFLNQAGRWAERRAPPFAPKEIQEQIAEQAKKGDVEVFKMIQAANFHSELAKQVPDGAIGVFAMLIEDKKGYQPVHCTAVPIRELEINIGPCGLDDRFVVKSIKYRDLKAKLPGIPIPEKYNEPGKQDTKAEVRWGYWRLWEKDDDEYWQHVVMIDQDMVHKAELKGEGSCPLVVGRFGATPDFAWPDGPMIKSLPELRTIDDTEAAFIENFDFTLRPPVTYDDDGIMNFEGGIEPGIAYPRRPGVGRDTVQKIYEPNPLDHALFDLTKRERKVKRLHYVDFPEQLGKTPPTLGQWLDEMVKAQKRIGTPGYLFWREFPHDVFMRFLYLAQARGDVQPIVVTGPDKQDRRVSLAAYNPAQRAQENQEVLTAMQFAQFGGQAFPQTWQVAVDDMQTLENFKAKLDDKLIALRSKDEIAAATEKLASLAGVGGPKLPGGLTGPPNG